jgi:hypothetical protein
MDKEKFGNGIMYLSVAILLIFTSATTLVIGFNKDNDPLFLSIAAILIMGLFYTGFKGISTILDAFFNKK